MVAVLLLHMCRVDVYFFSLKGPSSSTCSFKTNKLKVKLGPDSRLFAEVAAANTAQFQGSEASNSAAAVANANAAKAAGEDGDNTIIKLAFRGGNGIRVKGTSDAYADEVQDGVTIGVQVKLGRKKKKEKAEKDKDKEGGKGKDRKDRKIAAEVRDKRRFF